MATLTWTAATSGLWATATNWSPNQVPTTGDAALVTLPGAYLITLPAAVDVGSLMLGDAQAVVSVGGSLQVDGNLTITAGELAVAGTLVASGFSNSGTLVNTGAVTLEGTMTAASLEHIGGSGGLLTIDGTILNSGGTLDGASLDGQVIVSLGTLQGGTVVNLGGAGYSSTLDDVTWQGPLTYTYGSHLTITNGLTVTGAGGTGPGTLTTDGWLTGATIVTEFANSQTLDNATVSNFGTFLADNTLTIGGAATFSENPNQGPDPAAFVFSGNMIINHGTILGHSSATSSRDLVNDGLIQIQAADFENFGVIDAMDMTTPNTDMASWFPGNVTIAVTGSTFVNQSGGVIEVGQFAGMASMTIAATTNFTNDGTLLTQDSAPDSIEGGEIDIAAFLAGNGTVELSGGGTVTLEGAATSTQSIDFEGAGALILDLPQFVPSSINGLALGDTIDLGVAATGVSYTNGDLTMQISGGSTFDLAVTGTHALSDFIINTQSNSTSIQLACFTTGTRLATARGMVPVEALSEGDMMLLAGQSDALPVTWIGHRNVDCRHHASPRAAWPVRIVAGAFASGVPERDLYLSPDHAIFADGVLIPVKHLLNGHSVRQIAVNKIEYWHIELPRHAIMLAEGLSVESLLPGSNRASFDSDRGVIALNPSWNWECDGCAPLVVTGPQVDVLRELLLHRRHAAPRARRPAAQAA